jgi:hypothetical protein
VDNFKQYMKDNSDIEKSLAKLPEAHRKLVDGFHIKLEPGNTLRGDNGHVGVIMTNPKRQIKVASPWNYPREFALLHEVGHLVFEKWVRGTKLEKEWKKICKLNPNRKKDESDEENWCHSYSNHFVKHKVITHTHPEWEAYFNRFLKQFESE